MNKWPDDAPDGKAWKCPDCENWATLGGNAGYHRDKFKHKEPILVNLIKTYKKETIQKEIFNIDE